MSIKEDQITKKFQMHLGAIRNASKYKQRIKRHASIRRPVWPSVYDRLIPAVPPDDADEKGRARDGGHEGGRSQNSVTDFLRVNERFWDANLVAKAINGAR